MQEIFKYTVPSSKSIVACAISQCGSYLAFNSDANILQIVSLKSLRKDIFNKDLNSNVVPHVIFECKMGSVIRCLDFGWGNERNARLPHRSSKRRITYPVMNNACLLAVGLKSGQLKIYSLIPNCHNNDIQPMVEGEGNAKLVLQNHDEDLVALSFSFDGSLRLVSINVDGKICFWDMWDDGNMYKSVQLVHGFNPLACAWGNRSKQVCVTGKIGKACIYESEKPCLKLLTLEQIHRNDIISCKYTSDDSLLGTCSFDTSIIIWCAATYRPMLQIWQTGSKPSLILMGGSHAQYMRDFAFSPDCVNLVSLCDDNFIRLWNLEEWETPIDQHSVPNNGKKLLMNCIKFTPDGSTIVVCTSEGNIHFFNIDNCVESLANLCRKSVRERLVLQLHSIIYHNLSTPSKDSAIKSLTKCTDSCNRRRSKSWSEINDKNVVYLSDIIDELPVPGTIKTYLQYGLVGKELIDNMDPRPFKTYMMHHYFLVD